MNKSLKSNKKEIVTHNSSSQKCNYFNFLITCNHDIGVHFNNISEYFLLLLHSIYGDHFNGSIILNQVNILFI